MQPFTMERPNSPQQAIAACVEGAEFIAGGSDMLQLMKEWVRTPHRLVDLDDVLETDIRLDDGMLRIGAGANMEQVAIDPVVAQNAPAASQALLESASPQVRNLATMGGNLLQRTRCGYFRDVGVAACNKRRPGSGCAALDGENRMHAVLGVSDMCIATHPSDLAVALLALDASVELIAADATRVVPIDAFYRTWDTQPEIETNLRPGEIVAAIRIPVTELSRNSFYLKMRDRASFEWALLSVAVALRIDNGKIAEVRVAMGGVGAKPWRMRNVEAKLTGQTPDESNFAAAASVAADGAIAHGDNAFKIALMPKIVQRALTIGGGLP